MAKFFVGQMVKVVGATSFPELIGIQCIVTGIDSVAILCGTTEKVDGLIEIDARSPRFPKNSIAVYSEHLEPILYDGAQPIEESFDEMMGKLREGVVA